MTRACRQAGGAFSRHAGDRNAAWKLRSRGRHRPPPEVRRSVSRAFAGPFAIVGEGGRIAVALRDEVLAQARLNLTGGVKGVSGLAQLAGPGRHGISNHTDPLLRTAQAEPDQGFRADPTAQDMAGERA